VATARSSQAKIPPRIKSGFDLPSFVYLSAVFKQYGKYCVPQPHLTLNSLVGEGEPTKTFCQFLAEQIGEAKVLVFDVYSLKLIGAEETKRLLFYLRSYTNSAEHPLNFGLSCGLDYCLDAVRLHEAIFGVGAYPPLEWKSVMDHEKMPDAECWLKTPPIAIFSDDSGWGVEEDAVAISLDHILLAIAQGRIQASRNSSPVGKGAKTQPSKVKDHSEYFGATEQVVSNFNSNWLYLSGKFNWSGYSALFLEQAAEPVKPPVSVGPRRYIEGTKLAERNAKWQDQLNDMYKTGIDMGKPHAVLCQLLADKLNRARPPSVKKEISATTIRRDTYDPGKRKPGGRRPGK
jgi:hypothetical protein